MNISQVYGTEGLGEYFTSVWSLRGWVNTSQVYLLSTVTERLAEYFTSVLLGNTSQVYCLWSRRGWVNTSQAYCWVNTSLVYCLWSPRGWVILHKCVVYGHGGVG